jgi:uncharacterized protein YkwD
VMRPSLRRLLCIGLVAVASLGPLPRAGAAPTADEREAEVKLLKIINRARAAQELKLLKEHEVIRDEARAQSERMAEAGELNHAGFEARKNRIARADGGIDPDQICEATGSARSSNTRRSMKKIFTAWRADETLSDCLLDGLGYTSRSAGVGVTFADGIFWVTFIGASDDTPGDS